MNSEPQTPLSRSGDAHWAVAAKERPLSEIVNDIWLKAEVLIRQEIQLGLADAQGRIEVLKTELDTRVTTLKGELTTKVIGGAILYAGLLTLLAAFVIALAHVMSAWLAALSVGMVAGVTGLVMLRIHPQQGDGLYAPDGAQRHMTTTTQTNTQTSLGEPIK